MGQYWRVCNITKKEVIDPHNLGDGAKLGEFAMSSMGTMTALAYLLADSDETGGGDFENEPMTNLMGHWAGDKIVICGDYGTNGKYTRSKKRNLYDVTNTSYKDISTEMLYALMKDQYFRESAVENESFGIESEVHDFALIHSSKPEELPLLVGQMVSDDGKAILEKLLKKG